MASGARFSLLVLKGIGIPSRIIAAQNVRLILLSRVVTEISFSETQDHIKNIVKIQFIHFH